MSATSAPVRRRLFSLGSRGRLSRWSLGGLVDRAREHRRRTLEVEGAAFAVDQAVSALDVLAALEGGRLPTRRATPFGVSLEVARQALAWALLAHARASGEPRLQSCEVHDRASLATLLVGGSVASAFVAVSPADLDDARAVFAERTFAEDATLPAARCREDLRLLRTVAEHAVLPFVEAEGVVVRAWLWRVSLLLSIAGLLAVVSTIIVQRARQASFGPNVALHAPVLTSSTSEYMADVIGAVDGERAVLGFHTRDEHDPWLRIDLGRERQVRRVLVYNRVDCCRERALPLEVYVSKDGNTWQLVSTRSERFTTWEASFPTATARYVKLMARARTYLHLSEVEVYER